jgi:uncharacterized ferritin-like protein (DUF455 family)
MTQAFVRELLEAHSGLLRSLGELGGLADDIGPDVNLPQLLRVALVNEINASELAAAWVPSTPEVDVKVALARQAGDEAGHFQLVEARLGALGISTADFSPPPANALFQYLRSLETTPERIAAGQVALESIAYRVNEGFMRLCEKFGDAETARLYRDIIQPDEQRHHSTGCELLARHATTPESQARARDASMRALEIAAEVRRAAAQKLGTTCFPGC